jgi:hypothetical protein
MAESLVMISACANTSRFFNWIVSDNYTFYSINQFGEMQ